MNKKNVLILVSVVLVILLVFGISLLVKPKVGAKDLLDPSLLTQNTATPSVTPTDAPQKEESKTQATKTPVATEETQTIQPTATPDTVKEVQTAQPTATPDTLKEGENAQPTATPDTANEVQTAQPTATPDTAKESENAQPTATPDTAKGAQPFPTLIPAQSYIKISIGDYSYAPMPLTEDASFTLKQSEEKQNTITIQKDGFTMSHSTCPDQTCVQQGEVTLENYKSRVLSNAIICLPNKVTLELLTAEEAQREWEFFSNLNTQK